MFRLPRLRALDESLSLKFVLPVIMDSCLTIIIGMVVSMVISSISPSALAATGMANTVVTVILALFSVITSSVSILVARQVGADENKEAADTIEQSIFLTLSIGIVLTVLFILLATPTLRLMMPTAEETLFLEAVRYFRVVMVSMPFYVMWSAFGGICRALGNSRMPMVASIAVNVAQLLFAWLTMSVMGLNEIGAGVSLVICRFVGAAVLFVALMKDHRRFVLKVRNMLRPNFATCKRLVRIGLPISFESSFVQIGYMLANSMAIALGTFESGVYQILNTINSFTGVPQGICSAVAMAAVGHLLGRKNYKDARKAGWLIWWVGIISGALLGFIAWGFGKPICGLYSSDPETINSSANLIWILLLMNFTGCSINVIDPQLRVGGDVKWVMTWTLLAVWLIRLPLTYFMCFHWNMGVLGIYLANTISLAFRMIVGIIRYCGNKWMFKKV